MRARLASGAGSARRGSPPATAGGAALGTTMCMHVCTNGGRTTRSWGSTEIFGDNRVNSRTPLDLGFLVREGGRRTEQRTPAGSGNESSGPFGSPGKTDSGSGDGSGFGTRGETPHSLGSHGAPGGRFVGPPGHQRPGSASGTEPAGPPVGHGHGAPAAHPRGHPNCHRGGRPAAPERGHGQPGQRDGAGRAPGRRAGTGSTRQRGSVPPTRPSRFGVRAELAPVASPVRVPPLATGPRVTAAIGSGFRPRAVGQPADTGQEKGHCPPHPPGSDGQ